jgi:hypothetical protein
MGLIEKRKIEALESEIAAYKKIIGKMTIREGKPFIKKSGGAAGGTTAKLFEVKYADGNHGDGVYRCAATRINSDRWTDQAGRVHTLIVALVDDLKKVD